MCKTNLYQDICSIYFVMRRLLDCVDSEKMHNVGRNEIKSCIVYNLKARLSFFIQNEENNDVLIYYKMISKHIFIIKLVT